MSEGLGLLKPVKLFLESEKNIRDKVDIYQKREVKCYSPFSAGKKLHFIFPGFFVRLKNDCLLTSAVTHLYLT